MTRALFLSALLGGGCGATPVPRPAASTASTTDVAGTSDTPELADSAALAVLTVSILDPTTFEPLADGDELPIFTCECGTFPYAGFALDIGGTSGAVEVDPTGSTPDYSDLVNPASDGFFQLVATNSPEIWRLDDGRAVLTITEPPALAALDGDTVAFRVDVTDLVSQQTAAQTLSLVAALVSP